MAFRFLKKAAKGIASAGKFAYKNVKKLPSPIAILVLQHLEPKPIKEAINKIEPYIKYVPLLNKLFKLNGGATMNPFEKVIRELADVIEAATTNNGMVVAELIEAVVSIGPAYTAINNLNDQEKLDMLKEALDNTIGDESDAVFGPFGKVKFSVPFVGTEAITDLIISGAIEYMKTKKNTTP